MRLTIYQIDAFTDKLFCGNPAAVIPLKKWIDDELMQQIALENNLSETVFFVPSDTKGYDYEIRWFTPEVESTYAAMQHWQALMYCSIYWIIKRSRSISVVKAGY